MIYVEAPNTVVSDKKSIFFAGGITGCPDWQKELLEKIKDLDLIVYNPRRKNFPIDDPSASQVQIKWEFDHLRKASMISFWFCKETMCPIVLYELGAWSMTPIPIIIGIEPGYERKQDVEIQTKLVRPDVKIVSSLNELSDSIALMNNEIQMI